MKTVIRLVVGVFLISACASPQNNSPIIPIDEITIEYGIITRISGQNVLWAVGTPAPPGLWKPEITGQEFAYRLWHGNCTGTGRLYQCDGGLEVFQANDPTRPALDRYHTPQDAVTVEADQQYLYVTWCAADPLMGKSKSGGGLKVLDRSAGGKLIEIGSLETSCAMGIALDGNQAYLATWQGLVVVDVSRPASLMRLGTFTADGFPTQVAISGRSAYVSWLAPCVVSSFPANCDRSLRVLDISNPRSITETSAYALTELSPEKLAKWVPL